MSWGRLLGVFVLSGFLGAAAFAAPGSAGAASKKADQTAPKVAAGLARSVKPQPKPQQPIVMGRSVSSSHRSKLHHLKIKPLDVRESQAANSN